MFTITTDYRTECNDRDFDSIEAAKADFALMLTVAKKNADVMSIDLIDNTAGTLLQSWAR